MYIGCLSKYLADAAIKDNYLAWQGRPETLMLSAVHMGLEFLASGPTDKSVGYFHMSIRDKMLIHRKVGMHHYLSISNPASATLSGFVCVMHRWSCGHGFRWHARQSTSLSYFGRGRGIARVIRVHQRYGVSFEGYGDVAGAGIDCNQ